MDVSLIKFTVLRHDEHAAKFHKLASQVEFKLGLGPCGRYVDHLESQIDYHGITITQTSYPEDFGHVFNTWRTLQENWSREYRLIHGRYDAKGVGFGNVQHMSLTEEGLKELHEKVTVYANKASALQEQREIKTFFYKLEDVRGRIVAIKK